MNKINIIISEISDCKNCMSINYDFECDSVDTRFSEPRLNFPCRYYINREKFLRNVSDCFEVTFKNKKYE